MFETTESQFNTSLAVYDFEESWLGQNVFLKILFGFIMLMLCLITTIGNMLVIYQYRKASMVGNLFIISLACADLIVGIFVMPLASIYAFTGIWTMPLLLCQIWLIADYTASTASIFNLLTLSIDRYWSITSPLKYLGKRTKSRALIMVSLAWSISLLWLIPILGWPYFFNNNIRYVPESKCNTEYNQNLPFKMTAAVFNFYLPLIAMICINTKVYLVIQKRYQSPIMKYTSRCSNTHNPLFIKSTSKMRGSLNFNMKKEQVTYKSAASIESDNIPNEFKKKTALVNNNTSLDYSTHDQVYRKRQNFNLMHKKMYSAEIPRDRSSDTGKNKDHQVEKHLTNFNRESYSIYSKKKNLFRDLKSNGYSVDNSIETESSSKLNLNLETDIKDENGKMLMKESELEKQSYFHNKSKEMDLISLYALESKSELNKIYNARKKKISKEKIYLNKQEKAFKQLVAIVVGFSFCFLPYFVAFLVVAVCEKCLTEQFYTFTIWLGYLNSTINPFLYALSWNRLNVRAGNKNPDSPFNAYHQNTSLNMEQYSTIYIRKNASRSKL